MTRAEVLHQQIENAFTYHSPKADQPARYQLLRDTAKKLAYQICANCPDGSRETDLAMEKLKEAVMWANASIAINE